MNVIANFGIKALEVLFAAGVIGSFAVILLTSIEDTQEIVSPSQNEDGAEQSGQDAEAEFTQ